MDIKNLSIDKIDLSNRARNALHRAKVHTVGELLKQSEETLSGFSNIGRKTIDEVLIVIERYRKIEEAGELPGDLSDIADNLGTLKSNDTGKAMLISWLGGKQIDLLKRLSTKPYNLLLLNGYEKLAEIVFMTENELVQTIPRMDDKSAAEIIECCNQYLEENKEEILNAGREMVESMSEDFTMLDMLHMPEYHDVILKFVRSNDRCIANMPLSNRSRNCLARSGYINLSDIIFMTNIELQQIPAMGTKSIEEIIALISEYIVSNEKRLKAICNGDTSALIDDDAIRSEILRIYNEIGFGGLSLDEMLSRLNLPDSITRDRVKMIIGRLLAERELEYIDYRCYRLYDKFADYLETYDGIEGRNKDVVRKRLNGDTLEGIAKVYDLTRERVRQIENKAKQKLIDSHFSKTGKEYFDEDYYRYFYSEYSFEKKDAVAWFGMTDIICNYMEMMGVKKGEKDLDLALEDRQLDTGLKLKIKNYLNRNKIYVDGIWVEKKRASLEETVARKFCNDSMGYADFVRVYNSFLEDQEIPYDEDIYYTETVYRSRKNALADSNCILWKQNEQLRYYDIQGRDYTELLETLNFDSYENIEFSTLKFIEAYPDIMRKYDIRDQYELHNLLRKILKDGDFHDLHFGKMPHIRFGIFNKEEAIYNLMITNAPIGMQEFTGIIHEEYGYDNLLIQSTYLQCVKEYLDRGVYRVDQKVMPDDRKKVLKDKLCNPFYFINEIKKIYKDLYADADIEEINPYNLKTMGFIVSSDYALQNYLSLDSFFEDILTKEDIYDLTPYRKRYAYVQGFSTKIMELKRDLTIVEFEPNQIISFRKLKQSGVSREDIALFCDQIYDFVDDNRYFSIKSIKEDGFDAELFELGFTDWFYANLLIGDNRFSFGKMFGNIILYKGNENITAMKFEIERIKEYGSIDTYDLITEMTEHYGCIIPDHMDVIYKLGGSSVYYDKILDRLYIDDDAYYRDLDESEAI